MSAKNKPKSKPAANGPPTPAGDVLTLAEAAAFLRVPEDGLRKDADAGRVPGRLIAGEWRFAKGALLAWLSPAVSGQPSTPPGQEVVRKALPADLNKGFLSVIGAFADDETLGPMVEEIYRERKRNPVGG